MDAVQQAKTLCDSLKAYRATAPAGEKQTAAR